MNINYSAHESAIPDGAAPQKRRGRRPVPRGPAISIETRLNCGVISIEELAILAGFSAPKIRLDEQRGLVSFVKIEGCTRILGPVAKKYLGYDVKEAG